MHVSPGMSRHGFWGGSGLGRMLSLFLGAGPGAVARVGLGDGAEVVVVVGDEGAGQQLWCGMAGNSNGVVHTYCKGTVGAASYVLPVE